MSLVSVSDSSIIDHTLHPNSHPSSICVLSSHLLRCPKIGQVGGIKDMKILIGGQLGSGGEILDDTKS